METIDRDRLRFLLATAADAAFDMSPINVMRQHVAEKLILDGEFKPDYDQGRITDELEALVWAVLIDGDWRVWVDPTQIKRNVLIESINRSRPLFKNVSYQHEWEGMLDMFADDIDDSLTNCGVVAKQMLEEWYRRHPA